MTDATEPKPESTSGEKASNYPPNSQRSKTDRGDRTGKPGGPQAAEPKGEKERVKKIISGEAKTRKRGLGRKIKDTFTDGDMENVGNYILFDVIIPTTKNLIVDIITQSVERTFFGNARPSSRSGGGFVGRPSQTNYQGYYKTGSSSPVGRASEPDGPSISKRARAVHEFGEIILDSRGEADSVLDLLREQIARYDVATVADLLDAVGISPKFTDDRWGWSSLAEAGVERLRGGGYILVLPATESIQ